MTDIKRTLLTGGLIAAVLLFMPFYFNIIGYEPGSAAHDETVVQKNAVSDIVISRPPSTNINTSKALSPSETAAADEELFSIKNNKFSALLSNWSGGSLVHYELNKDIKQYAGGYNDLGQYEESLPVSLLLNSDKRCAPCITTSLTSEEEEQVLSVPLPLVSSSVPLIMGADGVQQIFLQEGMSATLVFRQEGLIEKTVTIEYDNFVIKHRLRVLPGASFKVGLMWDKGLRNTEQNLVDEISYSLASVGSDKIIEDISLSPGSISDKIDKKSFARADWAAIRNKYFIMAMVPENPVEASYSASSYFLNDKALVPSYATNIRAAALNQDLSCRVFLGPLDLEQINSLDTYLDRIMNFGWFVLQPFSRSILWLLKFFHGVGLNYGVILVLFAFIVRFLTGPLTKKSYESSQKMQELQPKIQSLQEKYKKNPQKLNQETIKLYKESGTNPLGGCLPMLLQMPLLFSLFIVFRSTIEFRGAPFFGWISNLSQPDTIISLPINIPLYGDQIAFLPILLGITMFLSQRISMASMDPKQKPFMYIMSVFFYLIFNSFPSGLNLYYVVYNILNYFQQKSLKRPT